MSHFNVMVIGGAPIEEQLAPFVEAGAGCGAEYIKFVDKTDEIAKEYESGSINMFVAADGTMLHTWDYATKHLDGEVKNVPFKEIYKDLKAFAIGYHNHEERDGRFGYEANPNVKLDWYVIGGRWSGFFRLRQVTQLPPPNTHMIESAGLSYAELSVLYIMLRDNPDKFNRVVSRYKGKEDAVKKAIAELQQSEPAFAPGDKGVKGVAGSCANDGEGFADVVVKKNIDVEFMRLAAEAEARELYHKVMDTTGGIPADHIRWEDLVKKVEANEIDIDKAREVYGAQPHVKAYRELHMLFTPLEEFLVDEDTYAKRAYNSALSPFAFVKDGEWVESGEMGWFGMSRNDKDPDDWNTEFTKMFDALPDDTVITLVDCHV